MLESARHTGQGMQEYTGFTINMEYLVCVFAVEMCVDIFTQNFILFNVLICKHLSLCYVRGHIHVYLSCRPGTKYDPEQSDQFKIGSTMIS